MPTEIELLNAYNKYQIQLENNRIAVAKYKKTLKGKLKQREYCKKYYQKKKLENINQIKC